MANPWVDFVALIKENNRWIGKIDSITTSGHIIVTVEGRTDIGTIQVEGDPNSYTVGDFLFIEGNRVVSKAPNLKTITEEIIL